MTTFNATTEEKIIYLESRLDDVERELSIVTSKKYELEQRRVNLLEKINNLEGKTTNLGFKKEVISEGITAFTLDSKTFR